MLILALVEGKVGFTLKKSLHKKHNLKEGSSYDKINLLGASSNRVTGYGVSPPEIPDSEKDYDTRPYPENDECSFDAFKIKKACFWT